VVPFLLSFLWTRAPCLTEPHEVTRGKIITNLDDLKAADLGKAELVEKKRIGAVSQ